MRLNGTPLYCWFDVHEKLFVTVLIYCVVSMKMRLFLAVPTENGTLWINSIGSKATVVASARSTEVNTASILLKLMVACISKERSFVSLTKRVFHQSHREHKHSSESEMENCWKSHSSTGMETRNRTTAPIQRQQEWWSLRWIKSLFFALQQPTQDAWCEGSIDLLFYLSWLSEVIRKMKCLNQRTTKTLLLLEIYPWLSGIEFRSE